MFKCATLSIKMRCREEGEAGVGICLYELLSQQANQRQVLLGQSEGSEFVYSQSVKRVCCWPRYCKVCFNPIYLQKGFKVLSLHLATSFNLEGRKEFDS